jgi:hypothetical protein
MHTVSVRVWHRCIASCFILQPLLPLLPLLPSLLLLLLLVPQLGPNALLHTTTHLCFMLYVTCYMLHVICYMLHVICYTAAITTTAIATVSAPTWQRCIASYCYPEPLLLPLLLLLLLVPQLGPNALLHTATQRSSSQARKLKCLSQLTRIEFSAALAS